MSDPKIISPLLDGFAMGDPISNHDGVSCCPAIKENSEEKYIVKIITIPSTQAQMDALLLAGAYKDASGAMDYFKTVVEDVFQEAELLKSLSQLDGFWGYEGWQMEPITRRRLGYQVYLLSPYRQSLQKFLLHNPITHLQAVNLGLDICSALSVCRQAGSLYVDLKPTNIFVSDKKEYRIGDLGFVPMEALNYTTLPDKYRSPYTPPELLDPMSNVNLTVDTYALGMILYQLYNDGQLPIRQEGEPLAAPIHGDYELSEIILKAIDLDPEKRWQDPKDMGQALIGYMQRNAVNDVSITPYAPLEAQGPEPPPPEDEAAPPDQDDTAPAEADGETLLPHEMSEEMSKMMEKADDLIAHQPPEGVVVPEIPDPPDPFAFAQEDNEYLDDPDPQPEVPDDEPEEKPKKKAKSFASQDGKQKRKDLISGAVLLAVAAVIILGFLFCYQKLYLQTINRLSITGTRDQLTVHVDGKIADGLLTASCTDPFGKVQTQPVTNGQASFAGLQSDTMYQISLEISGFHRLVGQTSEVFTTDTTTRILSFTSVVGEEEGSVILSFTPEGQEPEQWSLSYTAQGEPETNLMFPGHSVTIEGLELGKTYTFTLDAGPGLSLGGKTTLEVMPSRMILAENLTFTASGSDLTVHWKTPGDIKVANWTVRCYNDQGYDQTQEVQDMTATFSGIDLSQGYNLDITASGMTQSAKASVSPNPVNITGLTVDSADPKTLSLDWDYTGDAPEGGWLVLVSVEGSQMPDVVKAGHSEATITPRIPGAEYHFSILSADGSTVLGSEHSYLSEEAPAYNRNGLLPENLTTRLAATPSQKDWKFEQLQAEDFATEFHLGQKISVTMQSNTNFYHPGEEVEVLLLLRDSDGKVLPDCTAREKRVWKEIWEPGDSRTAELNIPSLPTFPGTFQVEVYIDGAKLAQAEFTLRKD